MNKALKFFLTALPLVAAIIGWSAYTIGTEISKSASEDPLVWEDDIREILKRTPTAPGSVIFTGSSSIRLWKTLAEDMQPLVAINRGFGGAKIGDTLHYADQLVDVENPRAIVIFVGTNDITPRAAKSPETVLDGYQRLVAKIRAMHSQVPIFYIAITPSPSRWEVWSIAQQANAMIKQYSDGQSDVHFIDTAAALMTDGKPNEDNYVFDGLHLNSKGYRLWTSIVRPRLLARLEP